MFCTRCGFRMEEIDRYCARCGAPSYPEPQPAAKPPERAAEKPKASSPPPPRQAASPHWRLSRPLDQKRIGGVCAGLARYLGVDVTLIRLIWIALALVSGGVVIPVYVVAWVIMPADETGSGHPCMAPHRA